MRIDENKKIELIGQIESIREYLLAQEPLIENNIIAIRADILTEKKESYYKELLTALLCKTDYNTYSGKRQIIKKITFIENQFSDSCSTSIDNIVAETPASDKKKKNTDINIFRIINTINKIFSDHNSKTNDPIYEIIKNNNSLEGLIKVISKYFKCLSRIQIFRFLNTIGYDVGIPDRRRLDFLCRLDVLNRKSKNIYMEYHDLCYTLSSSVNEKVRVIDFLFGLYSGAEEYKGRNIGVCIAAPECDECLLSDLCPYFKNNYVKSKINKSRIKDMDADLRPRERLDKFGAENLSDKDLLALFIRNGYKNKTEAKTALDLSNELLKKFEDLNSIDNASINELCSIKGIGKAKAIEIKAALELGKRLQKLNKIQRTKISKSESIYEIFKTRFINSKQERFFAVFLDTKNQIIKEKEISRGSLSSSIVHPREAFKDAIRESAASVIFVHNHPSGDPSPSKDDESISLRLKEVGDLVGIKVLDHIIIGNERYFSFSDEYGFF